MDFRCLRLEIKGQQCYVINDGLYYKVNEAAYHVLSDLQKGMSVQEVSAVRHVAEEDILAMVHSLEHPTHTFSIRQICKILPERVCHPLSRWLSCLWSPWVVAISAVLIAFSLWLYVTEYASYAVQVGGREGWVVLVSIYILLLFHELGHTSAAYIHGLTHLSVYLGVFFITPTFHVNLNPLCTWPRRQRLNVDGGGIWFQAIAFACLVLLYRLTGWNIWLAVANANLFLILYNLFPFFITDGYWLYSDFFGLENLNFKADQVIRKMFRLQSLSQFSTHVIVYSVVKFAVLVGMFYNIGRVVHHSIVHSAAIYQSFHFNQLTFHTVYCAITMALPVVLIATYISKLFVVCYKRVRK